MKTKHIVIPTGLVVSALTGAAWWLAGIAWHLYEQVQLHTYILKWHGLDKFP